MPPPDRRDLRAGDYRLMWDRFPWWRKARVWAIYWRMNWNAWRHGLPTFRHYHPANVAEGFRRLKEDDVDLSTR